MDAEKIIRFPGVSVRRTNPEPVIERPNEAELATAMAIAMRDYRNAFGVKRAQIAIFSQLYVLGLVDTPDLAVKAIQACSEAVTEPT